VAIALLVLVSLASRLLLRLKLSLEWDLAKLS